MLQNLFSIRQFWLRKWSFLVHSTTRYDPYIHRSHDSTREFDGLSQMGTYGRIRVAKIAFTRFSLTHNIVS